jgi:hypothetical protein
VTRKSKREIERELDALDDAASLLAEAAGEDSVSVRIRQMLVDVEGDVVGVAETLDVERDATGEWESTRETYDLPNDHGGEAR